MIDLERMRSMVDLSRQPLPSAGASGSGVVHAAVSVVIRTGPRPPELLLIKRAAAERDPWSGHMAFPGGKHEPDDAHLLDTARRETLEETGLELPAVAPGWVGRLPEVSPRGRGAERLPTLSVTPFLFRLGGAAEAFVASREVERVHWVPLTQLADPSRRGVYRLPIGGVVRSFPAIDVAGEQVWGLTWRVLDHLLDGLGMRTRRGTG